VEVAAGRDGTFIAVTTQSFLKPGRKKLYTSALKPVVLERSGSLLKIFTKNFTEGLCVSLRNELKGAGTGLRYAPVYWYSAGGAVLSAMVNQ